MAGDERCAMCNSRIFMGPGHGKWHNPTVGGERRPLTDHNVCNPVYEGEYVASPRAQIELSGAEERGAHFDHSFPESDTRKGRLRVPSGPTLGDNTQLGPLGRFLREFSEDAPPDPTKGMTHTRFVHLKRGQHI